MTIPNQADNSTVFLITTLANYQTEFWSEVGQVLRNRGAECAFLSFDDRSSEVLRQQNFEVFGMESLGSVPPDDAAIDARFAEFGLSDVANWLIHEQAAFGIRDVGALRTKLFRYLDLANKACTRLQSGKRNVVLVQEVGGFISVIASYFAARRHGIDNWFIEPSFFRGRLFWTRNTFGAPQPLAASRPVSTEVRDYLQNTLATKRIVVPLKDSHHYSKATKKVFNTRNASRLVQKLVDQHLLGKHQEFGHNFHHVRTHLRMLRNSMKLRGNYGALESLGRFVYYPFHVPADMALTLRAPAYLDQLALVRELALALPAGVKLAVKEHPAMIGALDASKILELLRAHPNLVILDPSCNNYDVLRNAELVASVNSKSGAESLLAGTPVLALGDSFYRESGLVDRLDDLAQLRPTLDNRLASPKISPDPERVAAFFQRIWDSSYPGELFVANQENALLFGESMLRAVNPDDATHRITAN